MKSANNIIQMFTKGTKMHIRRKLIEDEYHQKENMLQVKDKLQTNIVKFEVKIPFEVG